MTSSENSSVSVCTRCTVILVAAAARALSINSLIMSAKLSCSLLNTLHIPQHRGLKAFSIVFLPLCNFTFAVFRFSGFIKILKSDRKTKSMQVLSLHTRKNYTPRNRIYHFLKTCATYIAVLSKKRYTVIAVRILSVV